MREPGFLHVSIAEARSVAFVMLNGQKVDGVFALNDAEGWVDRYVKPHQVDEHGNLVSERLHGTVSIVWR